MIAKCFGRQRDSILVESMGTSEPGGGGVNLPAELNQVNVGLSVENRLVGGSDSHLPYLMWIFTIQVFFAGMLVLPTSFQLQRGAALVFLAGIAAALAFHHWRVRREILVLWLATMLVGAFGVTWGALNDAPGALRVSSVYLIWPMVYLLFIGLAHGLPVMRRMESALLVGISITTAMALIVLGAGLFGLGEEIYPLLAFQDAGFGAFDGFFEFRIYSLTTVMYGFPFVASLLAARRRELNGLQKAWLWLLMALMVVLALGSGRRMFWLILVMTPFLALFFLQLSALRFGLAGMLGMIVKIGMVAALAGGGLIAVFDLESAALAKEFGAAFLGQEKSSAVRYEQAEALWRAFESSPLIGVGLGSAVDVIRSVEQPWAYELAYLSLLKSVGLLGFSVYAVAIVWIVIKGMAAARRDAEFAAMFVPLVTALASFLIMNATNPYLEKFDYLWVLFLPLALINAYFTGRPSRA